MPEKIGPRRQLHEKNVLNKRYVCYNALFVTPLYVLHRSVLHSSMCYIAYMLHRSCVSPLYVLHQLQFCVHLVSNLEKNSAVWISFPAQLVCLLSDILRYFHHLLAGHGHLPCDKSTSGYWGLRSQGAGESRGTGGGQKKRTRKRQGEGALL